MKRNLWILSWLLMLYFTVAISYGETQDVYEDAHYKIVITPSQVTITQKVLSKDSKITNLRVEVSGDEELLKGDFVSAGGKVYKDVTIYQFEFGYGMILTIEFNENSETMSYVHYQTSNIPSTGLGTVWYSYGLPIYVDTTHQKIMDGRLYFEAEKFFEYLSIDFVPAGSQDTYAAVLEGELIFEFNTQNNDVLIKAIGSEETFKTTIKASLHQASDGALYVPIRDFADWFSLPYQWDSTHKQFHVGLEMGYEGLSYPWVKRFLSEKSMSVLSGFDALFPKAEESTFLLPFTDTLETNGEKALLEGYVNPKGDIIVPPKYGSAYAYYNGYAYVMDAVTDGVGLVDANGREVVKPIYYDIQISDDGSLVVLDDDLIYYHVDINGKPLYKTLYHDADKFVKGSAIVNGLNLSPYYSAAIDPAGNVLIETTQYELIKAIYATEMYIVKDNLTEKYGVIDKQKKIILPAVFEYIGGYYGEYVGVLYENQTYVYSTLKKAFVNEKEMQVKGMNPYVSDEISVYVKNDRYQSPTSGIYVYDAFGKKLFSTEGDELHTYQAIISDRYLLFDVGTDNFTNFVYDIKNNLFIKLPFEKGYYCSDGYYYIYEEDKGKSRLFHFLGDEVPIP